MDAETSLQARLLRDLYQGSPARAQPDERGWAGLRRAIIALSLISLCLVIGRRALISRDLSAVHDTLYPSILEESTGLLNVLVVGDWGRKGSYNQSAVAEQMGIVGAELDVDFIVSVGDNFYEDGLINVSDSAFTESFSEIYTAKSLQKTWHVVLGNHDYRGDVLAQLDPQLTLRDARWHCKRAFALRHMLQGSSRYVDFIFYDTNPFVKKYWNDTEHNYDWREVEPKEEYIRNETKFLSSWLSSSNATWKIVIGHHPIRTVGYHGNTVELEEQIYPILQQNNVDLYINGHDHCLEHIIESGIQFLTSGGGSKSWRGMDTNADMTGLQFYYDGQGFMSLSISATTLCFSFHDALGNTLHEKCLDKST